MQASLRGPGPAGWARAGWRLFPQAMSPQGDASHPQVPLEERVIFSGNLFQYQEDSKKWRNRFSLVPHNYGLVLYENKVVRPHPEPSSPSHSDSSLVWLGLWKTFCHLGAWEAPLGGAADTRFHPLSFCVNMGQPHAPRGVAHIRMPWNHPSSVYPRI